MSNEQIKLMQESFRQVAPIAETAAQLFYARLFELDAKAKALGLRYFNIPVSPNDPKDEQASSF